jgi:hypothetical protein
MNHIRKANCVRCTCGHWNKRQCLSRLAALNKSIVAISNTISRGTYLSFAYDALGSGVRLVSSLSIWVLYSLENKPQFMMASLLETSSFEKIVSK